MFCDTGCGPGTGGLAFADLFSLTKQWKYIGVDRSVPMMRKAEAFFQSEGYTNAHCSFVENFMAITDAQWQDLSEVPSLIIFNYSFFFDKTMYVRRRSWRRGSMRSQRNSRSTPI